MFKGACGTIISRLDQDSRRRAVGSVQTAVQTVVQARMQTKCRRCADGVGTRLCRYLLVLAGKGAFVCRYVVTRDPTWMQQRETVPEPHARSRGFSDLTST